MDKKAIKAAVERAAIFDSVVCRAGVWIGKRTYFYHHGTYPEGLRASVLALVPSAVIVSAQDFFKQWPAQSYMEVRWTVPAPSAGTP